MAESFAGIGDGDGLGAGDSGGSAVPVGLAPGRGEIGLGDSEPRGLPDESGAAPRGTSGGSGEEGRARLWY